MVAQTGKSASCILVDPARSNLNKLIEANIAKTGLSPLYKKAKGEETTRTGQAIKSPASLAGGRGLTPRSATKTKTGVTIISPKRQQYTEEELRQIHESRSPRAQHLDDALKHTITIMPDHPRTNRWAKDQGSSDILGIDSPPRVKKPTLKTPKVAKVKPPKNQLVSKKRGKIYHTKVGKSELLSRRPLGRVRK